MVKRGQVSAWVRGAENGGVWSLPLRLFASCFTDTDTDIPG